MLAAASSPATAKPAHDIFEPYDTGSFFDEMLTADGGIRSHYARFLSHFGELKSEEFEAKRHAVDMAFLRQGITFNVYGDAKGAERVFPFDLMPRIIPAS